MCVPATTEVRINIFLKCVTNVMLVMVTYTLPELDVCDYSFNVQTSSKLLEAGVKALKRTLIARKQAELHELDVQLALKTQDFRSCMEALASRRSELETQQRQVS